MKKTSKCLWVSTILATVYAIYLISYFQNATSSSQGVEKVGATIATALVTPHMIMFLIGAIFGWLGIFLKKSWPALVGAILYTVGSVLFIGYIMFGAPIFILGFIGYSNQKKLVKTQTIE